MFTALQALAEKATLLISVSTEGDLIRLNITPCSTDPKQKPTLRPLSLLATAEELDADLPAAIEAWSAPRKSLLDQVAESAAAADDDDESTSSGGKATKPSAPKKDPKSKTKKATDKKDDTPVDTGAASAPGVSTQNTGADTQPSEPGAGDAQTDSSDAQNKQSEPGTPASALDKEWQLPTASDGEPAGDAATRAAEQTADSAPSPPATTVDPKPTAPAFLDVF